MKIKLDIVKTGKRLKSKLKSGVNVNKKYPKILDKIYLSCDGGEARKFICGDKKPLIVFIFDINSVIPYPLIDIQY